MIWNQVSTACRLGDLDLTQLQGHVMIGDVKQASTKVFQCLLFEQCCVCDLLFWQTWVWVSIALYALITLYHNGLHGRNYQSAAKT